MQGHAVLARLMTPLAVLTGLRDYIFVLVDGDADEALVAGQIASLGVSINEAVFFPLAVATVFAFFVDFASVLTVEDGVKHHFGIVAVRVGLGAEALRVGQDPGVFAD